MIITTTEATVRNKEHTTLGVVAAETLRFAIKSKDLMEEREDVLKDMREAAFQKMQDQAEALGADAVVRVDINYKLSAYHDSKTNQGRSVVLLSISGTAVKLESDEPEGAGVVPVFGI